MQTSAVRPAFADRVKSVFTGKKKKEDATPAERDAANFEREPEYPGWHLPLPKKRLPEGWAKTPSEDREYVMASEGKDLEHVGSDKWLEQQRDDKPKYKGYEALHSVISRPMLTLGFSWKKVHNSSAMTPKDAEDQILKAAKEAGLKMDKAGLDLVIDPKMKFKVCKELAISIAQIANTKVPQFTKTLRASTKIQIPDIVMQRATTLKDFQQAILTKPKAKKLSFSLLANEELMANRNIQVRGGRQTPVHKDRAVGRWKLIEEELVNRGLPVFGHGIKADRGLKAD